MPRCPSIIPPTDYTLPPIPIKLKSSSRLRAGLTARCCRYHIPPPPPPLVFILLLFFLFLFLLLLPLFLFFLLLALMVINLNDDLVLGRSVPCLDTAFGRGITTAATVPECEWMSFLVFQRHLGTPFALVPVPEVVVRLFLDSCCLSVTKARENRQCVESGSPRCLTHDLLKFRLSRYGLLAVGGDVEIFHKPYALDAAVGDEASIAPALGWPSGELLGLLLRRHLGISGT